MSTGPLGNKISHGGHIDDFDGHGEGGGGGVERSRTSGSSGTSAVVATEKQVDGGSGVAVVSLTKKIFS